VSTTPAGACRKSVCAPRPAEADILHRRDATGSGAWAAWAIRQPPTPSTAATALFACPTAAVPAPARASSESARPLRPSAASLRGSRTRPLRRRPICASVPFCRRVRAAAEVSAAIMDRRAPRRCRNREWSCCAPSRCPFLCDLPRPAAAPGPSALAPVVLPDLVHDHCATAASQRPPAGRRCRLCQAIALGNRGVLLSVGHVQRGSVRSMLLIQSLSSAFAKRCSAAGPAERRVKQGRACCRCDRSRRRAYVETSIRVGDMQLGHRRPAERRPAHSALRRWRFSLPVVRSVAFHSFQRRGRPSSLGRAAHQEAPRLRDTRPASSLRLSYATTADAPAVLFSRSATRSRHVSASAYAATEPLRHWRGRSRRVSMTSSDSWPLISM